ncbi:hypothetical protein [Desulfocurvibacter africanus]|uniref:hypothetical protein n=1 Tax=Desulfocurvibacter africanus TaxID=873 RepID=UPI000424C38A|nr:hypothetical protein [Desulfocurvibacter africanus]
MARKPIHQQSRMRGQDHYWRIISDLDRDKKPITVSSVHALSNGSRAAVVDYVRRLVKGGYLRPAYMLGPAQVYELERGSLQTPRLDKDGQTVRMGSGREKMWLIMRMKKPFNYRELADAASADGVRVAEGEAKDYVKHLFKAGYLAEVEKFGPHRLARYRLCDDRDTGILPPQIQRTKQIWDPNEGRVVWSAGGVS